VYTRLQELWFLALEMRGLAPERFTKGVHGLRHFAGMFYADQTSDLRKVRDHLRHASMSSTEIYMAAARDTDEVREWSLGVDAD
jgi:integrase/recombinase XerC